MKTWRKRLLGSKGPVPDPAGQRTDTWNTLSTLGAGSVADVDGRGVVFPRNRPLSIEVWFGAGDKWSRGTAADGVRQTRIVGLPIIETRQRVGDADVVQTAWADESGDAKGRVIINLNNETDVAVVAAVVVRPHALLGRGWIQEVRSTDSLIVADKTPIVDLGRLPGDTATTIDDERSVSPLGELLVLGGAELNAQPSMTDPEGRASIAAIIPLTPGTDRQIQVVDGREASTVAPAPIDNVVAGWRAHLRDAAEFELPAWPKHIPVSLMSSLIGAAADGGVPPDPLWQPADDTILASALAGVGLDWAAANVADRLLNDLTEGRIRRDDWPAMAAVVGAIAGNRFGDDVLARHGDAVVAIAGAALSTSRAVALVPSLLRAVHSAHGADSAADAAAISGELKHVHDGVVLATHGVPTPAESAAAVDELLDGAPKPLSAASIGLAMVASADLERPFEPLVPIRSLAGSTWRWPRRGGTTGDSPHARAALLIGLRALCVSEYPGGPIDAQVTTDTPADLDAFPGMTAVWLGQHMQVKRVPTSAGVLSVALRWHGERPALRWEITEPTGLEFELRASRIDAEFVTSELHGEALLNAPTHLVPKGKKSLL